MIYGYIENVIVFLLIQLCYILAQKTTAAPTSAPSYGIINYYLINYLIS